MSRSYKWLPVINEDLFTGCGDERSRTTMTETLSKTDLRQWALRQRRRLSPSHIRRMSERVANNLKTVEGFRCARHIFTCLSFDNEVDMWRLVDELAAEPDRQVYVPRVDDSGIMHVHPYPCKLRTSRMGLRQPEPGETEVTRERVDTILDLALVLGLAFERRRGYRLGHDAGYFDRFLTGRPFCAIGLSFECSLVDRLPVEPHDIPMRMIVTEDHVYRYENKREKNLRRTVSR